MFCLKCSSDVEPASSTTTTAEAGTTAENDEQSASSSNWDRKKYEGFVCKILGINIPEETGGSEEEQLLAKIPLKYGPSSNAKKKRAFFNSSGGGFTLPTQIFTTGNNTMEEPVFLNNPEGGEVKSEETQPVFIVPPLQPPDEFPFCTICKKEIEDLYQIHEQMTLAVKQFESARDIFAADVVDTFYQQCENMGLDAGHRGKLKSAAEVFGKWKDCYTGKAAEASRLKYLLEEKDMEVMERERRLRRGVENGVDEGKLVMPRPYGLTAMQLARIQQAMTVSYFTPKMSAIRRRNRLYFKVGVKPEIGSITHVCKTCSKEFISLDTLNVHRLSHFIGIKKRFKSSLGAKVRRKQLQQNSALNAERMSNIACDGFPDSSDPLQDPLQLGKVHGRYQCQVCSRVFKLADHLKRHMYIHTGERPYRCGRCAKSFNQESNLKEHMYRHTGIRPHKCPHCDSSGYLRRSHLKEHMIREHGTDEVPMLPMGRASQNARKLGYHPVPDPANESRNIREVKPSSAVASTAASIPVVMLSSSDGQFEGETNNSSLGPNPKRKRTVGEGRGKDMPIINIKSDTSGPSGVMANSKDNQQQQYIIFL